MGKPVECYLQTNVGYKGTENGERLLRDCLWWEIADIEAMPCGPIRNHKNILLKFKSKADRKLFQYMYCEGNKQWGTNTLRVRMSKWKDVPYCRLNLEKIVVSEKVGELLDKQYPKWREGVKG